MTKEVMLTIRGLQFDQGPDSEEIETVQWGKYYKKDGTHYIIYDEMMEGFEEPVRNIIKIRKQEMNLTKRGAVNVYMAFEECKKNVTNYLTPYGSLLIGMDTRRVKFSEGEEEIRLLVEYALEVNYEYLADCRIEIRVQPAGKTAPDARLPVEKKGISTAHMKPQDRGESDSRMRM
ncbi:MAG TPA: DUF1934 domain-containing protein [Candidatus Eisenbergiella merdavium]|uniref:DUF1934 domain-containing protein n=1 Tax=Candidatus Eisenbergiella merdavium TaxID=2838551 RepID=A0A9D2NDJ3_9FIRM|nr:DUF1934 domain-containing protein [Candidatus Eisenbergiella merdavium]